MLVIFDLGQLKTSHFDKNLQFPHNTVAFLRERPLLEYSIDIGLIVYVQLPILALG
jgi:hypothetical protein